jgi:HlyD family secretion protein
MDTIVPQRRGKRWRAALAAGALVVAAGYGGWQLMPRGLQVPAADVQVATVTRGMFLDDIVLRAKAEALQSVILDSVESGRVEEVFARDGALVKAGDILFRISNSQRNLDLLQRQAEHTQQISNLANLRVAFEAGNSEHDRRLSDLRFNLEQAQKKHARNERLAAQGFISAMALEESADNLAQQKHLVSQENLRSNTENGVKRAAVDQMARAIKSIETGLALVNGTVDALVVRAPVAGRLTDFNLKVGETVKQDQHIGRVDDPGRYKLAAQVDEYYLGRVAVGHKGTVRQDGTAYPVEISRVFPQIKDGRFALELVFTGAQPSSLNPGQSLDAQVSLGEPKPALLLQNGPFANETGGTWAFVLAANGVDAEKRAIRAGRRNNRQVEILAGLNQGDQVLVSSYAPFGSATRLQLKKK